MNDDYKYRKLTLKSKLKTTPILQKRIEKRTKCVVQPCNEPTIYASSYCHKHRMCQKWSGSPFASLTELRVIAETLKGTAKTTLTSSTSDQLAFQRACNGVKRFSQNYYKTDAKTILKYRRHWANPYKARLALWMSLQTRKPEELLETALGAAMHIYIYRDDLAVTEQHVTKLLAKTMACVVVPATFSQGEKTCAGRLLVNILDDCYSAKYWRRRLLENTIKSENNNGG